MKTDQIVKYWKDEGYMQTLSAAEQALLPDTPAGLMELSDEDLVGAGGISVLPTIIIMVSIVTVTL